MREIVLLFLQICPIPFFFLVTSGLSVRHRSLGDTKTEVRDPALVQYMHCTVDTNKHYYDIYMHLKMSATNEDQKLVSEPSGGAEEDQSRKTLPAVPLETVVDRIIEQFNGII